MSEKEKPWKLRAMPVSELLAMGFPEKFDWGGWRLDGNTFELVLVPVIGGVQSGEYRVDLEEILNAAKALDWILHLEEKIWMGPEQTKGFITALHLIFDRSLFGELLTKEDVKQRVYNFLRSPTTAGEWAAMEKLMASDFSFDKEFLSGADQSW